MIDKSVPYHTIIMKRPPVEKGTYTRENVRLPDGFVISPYTKGDDFSWGEIEASVGSFDLPYTARAYFEKEFNPRRNRGKLCQQLLFARCNRTGKVVGTAAAWFADGKPIVHWIAVRPAFQNIKLGSALLRRVLGILSEMAPDQEIWLATQTTSHKAVGMYHREGFCIVKDGVLSGMQCEYDKAMPILKEKLSPELYESLEETAI